MRVFKRECEIQKDSTARNGFLFRYTCTVSIRHVRFLIKIGAGRLELDGVILEEVEQRCLDWGIEGRKKVSGREELVREREKERDEL